MARRKRVHQKPVSIDNGNVDKDGDESRHVGVGGESVVVDDDALPAKTEDVFKDSMAEFPEIGGSVKGDLLRDKVDLAQTGLRWSEQEEDLNNYANQAKDKWASFKDLLPNQGGARLQFEEPLVQDGHRIAQVELEEIAVETSNWNSAVVCTVLGANSPFTVFEGFIKRMWGKLGIERIARLNACHTLVKFRDETTRDLVLENGVLHFDRKPVIVRPWTVELDHLRMIKSVPVWVRLPGLGLQYWGTKCLSALVSTLGKPIMVDKVTMDRSMMQFAIVLVDIDIADEVPKSIQFLNERGQLMEQFVEFEWLPTQCKLCKVFGHTESLCNKKKDVVWRPKDQLVNGSKLDNSVEENIRGNSVVHKVASSSAPGTGEGDKTNLHDKALKGSQVQTNTESDAVDFNQVSKGDQVSVDRGSVSMVETEGDWITPRKVRGKKSLTYKAQNRVKNTYNVLLDKNGEDANLALLANKKSDGRVPNS
ncbi:uncharacterized protein LOC133806201 [Humulus lupulus]|uniref:uncharacterized protein LOC133806201 n=1 Tax=Humulus lupulus TaxID=3486 RepID=UPI002B40F06F|nr:uncharacterized protein LOC133806201 [Humulus lupulus]